MAQLQIRTRRRLSNYKKQSYFQKIFSDFTNEKIKKKPTEGIPLNNYILNLATKKTRGKN